MPVAKPTRLRLLAAILTLTVLTISPAAATEITRPTGVVELFTSQGCSSCPPADRVLGELTRRPDTLALAWHVDYWDYLGWKDTFARPANTKRQKAYARALSRRNVYTPQAVINGRLDVVGSRGNSVMAALDEFAGTSNGLTVEIDARISGDMLKINIENSPEANGATLWMVYFDRNRIVDVKRGENGGQRLSYSNIVRSMEMIGTVHDQALQTEFGIADISRRGHDACALILQKKTAHGDPGPIIGAAYLSELGV